MVSIKDTSNFKGFINGFLFTFEEIKNTFDRLNVNYHELKTIEPYYSEVAINQKTFEVRKNDRNFQIDDILLLRPYHVESKDYMDKSQCLLRKIVYILDNPNYVIENHIIMGIKPIEFYEVIKENTDTFRF